MVHRRYARVQMGKSLSLGDLNMFRVNTVPGANVFRIIHKSRNLMVVYVIYMDKQYSLESTKLSLALGEYCDRVKSFNVSYVFR